MFDHFWHLDGQIGSKAMVNLNRILLRIINGSVSTGMEGSVWPEYSINIFGPGFRFFYCSLEFLLKEIFSCMYLMRIKG